MKNTKPFYRIGIDIGGTFTDLCWTDTEGNIRKSKLLTTAEDPSVGFLKILDSAMAESGKAGPEASPGSIREIIHATTVATNAILEGKTARLGMITTAGFKDVLEIGRHFRRDLYNIHLEKPPVLVPRHLRLEINERISADGKVLEPVREGEVKQACENFLREDVEVILVCFLNSYVNPENEERVVEILRSACDVPVLTSHSLCPEIREFERFSTTAVNGAVTPLVRGYLQRIQIGLDERSITAPLSIMQSNAGVASAGTIEKEPASIVESGPAAGVISAVEVGRRLGFENLICFDMGGTTTKAALVRDGRVEIKTDYEVGGGMQGGFGNGYPLLSPVVDLVEIGTGGGSICQVNEMGNLLVGPRSAGADPGPVCYGRGGVEPTITDANAVLGRLQADYFAGGLFNLNLEAAEVAVSEQISRKCGLTGVQSARGIIKIAVAQMVRALQVVSVQRGYDPKNFVMVAFGGAGPMHAAELARELGCPKVIIPPEAGVQSAWGLIVADARLDYRSALGYSCTSIDLADVENKYTALVQQGKRELYAAGLEDSSIETRLGIDARYRGQEFAVTVETDAPDRFDPNLIHRINQKFHAWHERMFGHSNREAEVEWKLLRATVIGKIPAPSTARLKTPCKPLDERVHSVQRICWDDIHVESKIYHRSHLYSGDSIFGPALIIQPETTLVIPPEFSATVMESGDIILTHC